MKIRSPHDLSAAIKGQRLDLHLSQQALADKAGVSRKWISDLESGKTKVPFILVLAVCESLDLGMELTPTSGTGTNHG